jgi:hypothetical protein
VSGPGGITDDRTPTFTFASNEAGSSFECSIDGEPFSSCASPFTAPPLPGGLHTLRVRARDGAGNQGEPASFSFQIAQTLGELNATDPPTLGVDLNVAKVGSGRVLVGIPGAAARRAGARASQKGVTFVPLERARQIPVGSFLDTKRGTVRLTSARDSAGRTQTGDFGRGLFQVLQSRKRSAKGLTDIVLKGGRFTARVCGRPGRAGRARGSALSRRTIRRLRSNASGRFRTRGRHSAATVRGTVWETSDRCDGTLTKVTRGSVTVRDLRRRRNVVVRAGKSYLARAQR